jgi:thioredoxin 1
VTIGFANQSLTRADVDAFKGWALLEFGADWCGHCQAAQAPTAQALAQHPDIENRKVEDGKGRALGRSFAVKLWPTLILLHNGQEVARIVRPTTLSEVADFLNRAAMR